MNATASQTTLGFTSPTSQLDGLIRARWRNDLRGAQPRGDGYRRLRCLRVSMVVDLRSTASEQAAEQHAVESLGVQHVGIPRNGFFPSVRQPGGHISEASRDSPGRKIFVHCYFGDDRTGIMVASYRMAEQQALDNRPSLQRDARLSFPSSFFLMGRYVKFSPELR